MSDIYITLWEGEVGSVHAAHSKTKREAYSKAEILSDMFETKGLFTVIGPLNTRHYDSFYLPDGGHNAH